MKCFSILLLLLPQFTTAQDTISVSSEQRTFCLNVMKALIERDCDKYFNSVNDSVVYYGSLRDTILHRNDMRSHLYLMCMGTVRNDTLTYAYYLDNFRILFADAGEVADGIGYGMGERKSTLATLKHYHIQEGDVYFQGAYHKTRNRLDFVMDDAMKFVFRKVNGEYKIVVLLP